MRTGFSMTIYLRNIFVYTFSPHATCCERWVRRTTRNARRRKNGRREIIMWAWVLYVRVYVTCQRFRLSAHRVCMPTFDPEAEKFLVECDTSQHPAAVEADRNGALHAVLLVVSTCAMVLLIVNHTDLLSFDTIRLKIFQTVSANFEYNFN